MAETVILRRNSEIQDYKECRQKWWWAYHDNLRPKAAQPALELGTLVHAALELYYPPGRKRGPLPHRSAVKLYRAYLKKGYPEVKVKIGNKADDDAAYVPMDELAVEMLSNYVNYYGSDDFVEVLAPEQKFQVDIHHPKSGRYLFTVVGTIDLCFRDRRTMQIGFMEHKTGVKLEPFGAPEALDEQSGTYWTYGPHWLKHIGAIAEDDVLDFIMFNRLRKAFGDQRPKNEQGQALNKDGSVSKVQPAPLFKRSMVYRNAHDQRILDRRVREVDREMKMVERGTLKVYKAPGRQCDFCAFRHMCEVHESGGDWQAMKKSLYYIDDHYSEHAEEEDWF